MPLALPRKGVRHLIGGEGRVEDLPEILLKSLGKGVRGRVTLHHRKAARPDTVLQIRLSGCVLGRGCDIVPALGARIFRRTEIEECSPRHAGVIQYPMQDLELGDASAAAMPLEPGLPFQQVRRIAISRRNPAVTLTQHPHKEGPRPVNLREADRQHLAAFRLLCRDAPAQIDIHELNVPIPQPRPQARKHLPNQQIALLAKVAKGRGEKYADRAIGRYGHYPCCQ